MYRSFIESQFPVSLVSKEAYKERKAGAGQTLTGLGKWWGRKPLVLVRATIVGLLMPASGHPEKDLDVFLRIMTMDDAGRLARKNKKLSTKEIVALLGRERGHYFNDQGTWLASVSVDERTALENRLFLSLPYEEQLEYCLRPEQIAGPSTEAWIAINEHLGTHAASLSELVDELGKRHFGRTPRVGDAFCGGGSIPFEAARIGCEAFGNDLNPAAALLTWGALNLVGGGQAQAEKIKAEQARLLAEVDAQITEWGIEHDSLGRRADAFLYLTETKCPSCDWTVPVAPSFIIGEKTKTVAVLREDSGNTRYHIDVQSDVSPSALAVAKKGTVKAGRLTCPHCGDSHGIADLRGDKTVIRDVIKADGTIEKAKENAWGLRKWENEDLVPRATDVFQERLYCIRWVETALDGEKPKTRRIYASVRNEDLAREEKVLSLLQERFEAWQAAGYVPSRKIEPGFNTAQPMRERGWTHWHHLFNPRQLLVLGLVSEEICHASSDIAPYILLRLGRLTDFGNKGCVWNTGRDEPANMSLNQAFNTLFNYGTRAFSKHAGTFGSVFSVCNEGSPGVITIGDSRRIEKSSDFWITDPPYADAVNYDELSEFFLAWYDKHLTRLFPEWYSDSRRQHAVRGNDIPFRQTMVEVYRNLARNMPANGKQVVMFTHQDPEVWADLALIMWAAGLEVTAAWTISTETTSGLKEGNYVTGTVCMVLQKQSSDEVGLLDNSFMKQIEAKVRQTLSAMRELDSKAVSSYVDSDYLLAAYAAAMQLCTQYKQLYGKTEITPEAFLYAPRGKEWKHPFSGVLERAIQAAMDFLMPKQFAAGESAADRRRDWQDLTTTERFYLKCLELEHVGVTTQGAYQEYARGFSMRQYDDLIADKKANHYRIKNPAELRRSAGTDGFKETPLRTLLQAIHEAIQKDDVDEGLRVLKSGNESLYWANRERLVRCLQYFQALDLSSWKSCMPMIEMIKRRIESDAHTQVRSS